MARRGWIAALGVAVLSTALFLWPRHGENRERGGGRGEKPAREEPLRAAGVAAVPARLQERVGAVGELSRRLVKVHAVEGARVAAGDLLFELDDADLRAALAELEARHQLAKSTLGRQRALVSGDKKALSQQALDQSRAELGAIDAQIVAVRVTLAKTDIRAPFAGTIGLRRVSEGAWVTPETVLTTLQDTSRVKIDFTLPERYAPALRVGQSFSFTVAGRGDTFHGEIIAIEPVIESATRSLLARGISDNSKGALFPGAFASVEVPIEGGGGGVMVPAEAVIPSVDGHGVFVFRDGHAELRKVDIGTRGTDAVQILRGLEEGETVLTTNLLRLTPGRAVELEKRGAGT